MAPASAKLLFVVVLCLNVLTWSQSRYGKPSSLASYSGASASLFKRSYDSTLGGQDQCIPLSVPPTDQCRHVVENCGESSTVLGITYLQIYYCTDLPIRPLAFAGLLTWLLFLFSTLGISASDFFTPNLGTLAQLLGLDENVAGVTFLAFGNGSPDVFSTFSAMRAGSGGLAIGELVGAATFIVSCVVGSMCIIKPFHVDPRPFLRDVGFFTVAISLMVFILRDNKIRPWEALSLIGLYIVYVVVVVVGSWWERRMERRHAFDAIIRSEYQDEEQIFDRYTDEPFNGDQLAVQIPARGRAASAPASPRLDTANLSPRPRLYHSRSSTPVSGHGHGHAQLPSFSFVGALEFREVVASLQREATTSSLSMFESPITPYAGGHYYSHSLRRGRRTSQSSIETLAGLSLDDRNSTRAPSPTTAINSAADNADRQGLRTVDSSDYFGQQPHRHGSAVPSILRTPASPTASDHDEVLYSPPRHPVVEVMYQVFHTLFPTLHHIQDQSVIGAIACLFAAPAVLLLTITLPVVVSHRDEDEHHRSDPKTTGSGVDESPLIEFEEEGTERVLIAEEEVEEEMHHRPLEYNKWLMATQCIFGPLFCVVVLFSRTTAQFWLLIAALVGGVTIATLVVAVGGNGAHLSAKMIRCSMGFFVSIVWIMAIADEVVNVLQAFGIIFGLSEAILGLTIFAMGNSVPDLVANMSVAVFAPIMGFSACFGGPMLNILMGIGLTGSVIMQQTGEPYELELSKTLLVSSLGLLSLLTATLVFVPLNGYYLSRSWGALLIVSYVAIMTTNVIVELKT